MNEAEIRACGGDLVAAVRPHVMDGIREEDREVADRIFTTTTTLLLQVLVDINRIATALERDRGPFIASTPGPRFIVTGPPMSGTEPAHP